jgi:TrmH family RNA methyltransferase
MVSKSQIKLLNSLSQKKYRAKNKMFRAEGVKLVKDILTSGIKPNYIFTTDPSLDFSGREFSEVPSSIIIPMDSATAKKCSLLSTPSTVIAIFDQPEFESRDLSGDLCLALDGISDPGNLGTIIRLADWFGIDTVYASPETVDVYNPKVVQSTMGSLARVSVEYTDLAELSAKAIESGYHISGTFMEGESIYEAAPAKRLLIMGSEAHGISSELQGSVTEKLTIPRFSEPGPESLNVAVATSILISKLSTL